jgi:hypothetical protein
MNPVKQKMEEKWRLSYRIVEMYGQWRRKRAAGAGLVRWYISQIARSDPCASTESQRDGISDSFNASQDTR